MIALTPDSLMTLEAYAKSRSEFRRKVLEHKKHRTVHVGGHVTLLFEDELTVRYQIQEMLRIEKIFEEDGIRHEIDAYGPLIPDGSNLKATMLIEYPEADERKEALRRLKGVERRVWLRVDGCAAVFPFADEDLERENDEKTSSVHFLRWELEPAAIAAAKKGAGLSIGVDHDAYRVEVAVPSATVSALAADLD